MSTVEPDFFGSRKKTLLFEAQIRGQHKPKLKFGNGDKITEISPDPINIPNLTKGYYPMKSGVHGLALIINNKTFTGKLKDDTRIGSDRDEYNLVETWLYLGYQVVVCRESTKIEMENIFNEIDKLLSNISSKSKIKVSNDSFVCCILSHGDKSCIYTSDSQKVDIKYLEVCMGKSKILNSKPKMLFIQACQGEGLGTAEVQSIRPDGCERSDVYISYAAAPGDQCYRNIETGSWFVCALCKVLCKESTSSSLNEIQHAINCEVASDPDLVYSSRFGELYKQQPSCSDQLEKSVHFFQS